MKFDISSFAKPPLIGGLHDETIEAESYLILWKITEIVQCEVIIDEFDERRAIDRDDHRSIPVTPSTIGLLVQRHNFITRRNSLHEHVA
jgi:hypothetical protein